DGADAVPGAVDRTDRSRGGALVGRAASAEALHGGRAGSDSEEVPREGAGVEEGEGRMSVLADRLRSSSADLRDLASVIGELERDYYRDMSVRLMEMVDRQSLSYAEAVQVEELERKVGAA